jgi:predicted aspartyl protease
MDDLFWGRDYEDVSDWAEQLTMAAEVRDLTLDKLFKIAKLNLRGRAKEWFRRLQPAPANWAELHTLMIQKYGNIDADDIRMKMDAIKQEPKERVQKYFERLDKLFRKGQIQDVEQRRRFLARLRPEIRKLCVVRVFANIEELVGATTEVERVIGELGETPYEPLREEHDEDTSESNVEKQVTTLNNTLINFFKGNSQDSASSSSSTAFGGCQLCKGKDHMATACPRLNEARPKCAKCNLPHRTENCGVKCTFCTGLGHSEDKCWKKPKDGKSTAGAANFLEVMLDDEAATEQQLNKLCGNESVFSYTRVPRRRTPVDMAPGGITPVPEAEREGTSMRRDVSVKSKILSHFIKGKFSLSPMEIVLMIPGELEHLENLVKLARRKRDSETTENQVSVVSATPSLKRICVSKTHRSKTLHLPVDISDCIIEGLVDTGASMSVLAPAVVRELGIMHLVTWNESYKTTSGIVTQALGWVDEVQVKIGGVQCAMTFMVVDTDGYDVLLGLDFLMKIGAMVDVERGLIQVRHEPGTNVEVSPLTMVNLLQRMNADAMRSGTATFWKDAPANQGGDVQSDQDQKTIDGGDDESVSDSDDESDNDEFHDSESNPLEQGDSNDEFVDAKFEELVNSEGPQEMLQLMLQEQTDGIMIEGNSDGDDYAHWTKWSSDAEENRLSVRKSARDVLGPALLQKHKPNHDFVIPMILQTA